MIPLSKYGGTIEQMWESIALAMTRTVPKIVEGNSKYYGKGNDNNNDNGMGNSTDDAEGKTQGDGDGLQGGL
jgi:hypothetical protein